MKKIFLILMMFLYAATARAENAGNITNAGTASAGPTDSVPNNASSDAKTAKAVPPPPEPVEISASKSLDWNRKDRTYIARVNAVAIQGAARLQSDTITARYEDDDAATDITTLEADNHVIITSVPYTATGDKGTYDVKTGYAVLTGKDLKITTDTEIIRARDKIEYFKDENKMTAIGNAMAKNEKDQIFADILTSTFVKEADGKTVAHVITAHGHVVIKTETETATGDDGIYDVQTQKAVLTGGKVRILQDKNWLEGTRVDVDMDTGISRLSNMGSPVEDQRVTGMFYPKPKDQQKNGPKPEDKKN